MIASVVANGFVSDAISKTVSRVIGSGSGTMRREPTARKYSVSSPRPTSTTTPGISVEPTASAMASSMGAKSSGGSAARAELSGMSSAAPNINALIATEARDTAPILTSALGNVDILGAMQGARRVFVTGGTGFVGRAVIHALRAEGYAVRCLVRRGSERDLRGFGAIERVEGDVMARQTLEDGISGCDTVVHLVGIIREQP